MSSSPTDVLVDVTMPQMGVSVAEGTIVAWRVEVGDRIEADATIAEISTDKIDTEVPAPASGVVAEIIVPVESTVSVGTVLAQHGRIDALLNNAGGQYPSALKDISLKGWEAVVKTNLTGGFLMARECLNQWMLQHGGAVVNIIADMWGSMPGMGHSGAARAGMVSITETAALEWAQYGVRVNAVAPTYIATPLNAFVKSNPAMYDAWISGTPMARLGEVEEIASFVLFLASDAASLMTGSIVLADGGYTCW